MTHPLKVVQEGPCKHLLDIEPVALNGLAGVVEVGMVELDAILVMQRLQMHTHAGKYLATAHASKQATKLGCAGRRFCLRLVW